MGSPFSSGAFAETNALTVVGDKAVKGLARLLPRMPDMQSAILVATNARANTIAYIDRWFDACSCTLHATGA